MNDFKHADSFHAMFSTVASEAAQLSESVRRFDRRYRGAVSDQPADATARRRALKAVRDLRELAAWIELKTEELRPTP